MVALGAAQSFIYAATIISHSCEFQACTAALVARVSVEVSES